MTKELMYLSNPLPCIKMHGNIVRKVIEQCRTPVPIFLFSLIHKCLLTFINNYLGILVIPKPYIICGNYDKNKLYKGICGKARSA
jgi:hypothetical protein